MTSQEIKKEIYSSVKNPIGDSIWNSVSCFVEVSVWDSVLIPVGDSVGSSVNSKLNDYDFTKY